MATNMAPLPEHATTAMATRQPPAQSAGLMVWPALQTVTVLRKAQAHPSMLVGTLLVGTWHTSQVAEWIAAPVTMGTRTDQCPIKTSISALR
jgi:hypothetical protein